MLRKDGRLRAFHAVALHGSFTRAAAVLSLTQQAVSFQVHALEQEVGTRLFRRDGKGVELTDAGEVLFRYAKQIIELYAAANEELDQLHGALRGVLRVGATGSIAKYCVPPAIGAFRRLHGTVSVSVSVANTESVIGLLVRDAVDVGLVSGGPTKLEQFKVHTLFEDELVVIAPADHPLSARTTVSVELLRNEAFVLREEGSGTRRLMDEHFAAVNLPLDDLVTAVTLGTTEAVIAAVAAGAGLAMVSRLSLRGSNPSVAVLAMDWEPLRRTFYIVRPEVTRHEKAVSSFIRCLKKIASR